MEDTPQNRRIKKHAQDMYDHPERHFFDKDVYTYEEATEFCFHCWEDERDKFKANIAARTIHRIK